MRYSPSTRGFYEDGGDAPEDAVAVAADDYRALFDAQAAGNRIEPNGDGYPIAIEPTPLPFTQEAMLAAMQTHMDEKAQEMRYASLADVLSYAGDANADFAADAAVFRTWRTAVRTFTLAANPAVYGGPIDFRAALPAFPS